MAWRCSYGGACALRWWPRRDGACPLSCPLNRPDTLPQPYMSTGQRGQGTGCTDLFHPRLMPRWPNGHISSCSLSTFCTSQNSRGPKIFYLLHWSSVTRIPYCSGLLETSESKLTGLFLDIFARNSVRPKCGYLLDTRKWYLLIAIFYTYLFLKLIQK